MADYKFGYLAWAQDVNCKLRNAGLPGLRDLAEQDYGFNWIHKFRRDYFERGLTPQQAAIELAGRVK
jgi:hypothetical protein